MTHTLIDLKTLRTLTDRGNVVFDDLVYDGNLADDRQYSAAIEVAEKLIKTPVRPIVVCNITGGVLQGASADYPVEVICLDFDTDGVDEIDGSNCHISTAWIDIDPPFVAEVSAKC